MHDQVSMQNPIVFAQFVYDNLLYSICNRLTLLFTEFSEYPILILYIGYLLDNYFDVYPFPYAK